MGHTKEIPNKSAKKVPFYRFSLGIYLVLADFRLVKCENRYFSEKSRGWRPRGPEKLTFSGCLFFPNDGKKWPHSTSTFSGF